MIRGGGRGRWVRRGQKTLCLSEDGVRITCAGAVRIDVRGRGWVQLYHVMYRHVVLLFRSRYWEAGAVRSKLRFRFVLLGKMVVTILCSSVDNVGQVSSGVSI